MRPRRICSRCRQCPKFGNETIACRPDAQHLGDDLLDVPHRLQRLRQDHELEVSSSKPASPASRSRWMTLMLFAMLARTPASVISTP